MMNKEQKKNYISDMSAQFDKSEAGERLNMEGFKV